MGFREKIENWLAPENVRTGTPTYIPRQKKQTLPAGSVAPKEEEKSSEQSEDLGDSTRAYCVAVGQLAAQNIVQFAHTAHDFVRYIDSIQTHPITASPEIQAAHREQTSGRTAN